MNTDLRRSKRYNDFMAVSILARNILTGEKEAGPFAGRIINISRHGACVLLSLGVLDTYNVYRSAHRNDSLELEIQGSIPSRMIRFSISGRPIWMDPFVLDEIKAYKMGVEFISDTAIEQADDIIESITSHPADDIFELDMKI